MTSSWTDTWIGPRDAPIVVFNKGGRDLRLGSLERGREAPREFFYGYLELAARGAPVAMAPVSGAMPGVAGRLAERLDSVITNSTLVGVRPLSLRLMSRDLSDRHLLVGFTDGFSMSLGLAGPQTVGRAVRIGGFHCLSDIAARARPWARGWAHRIVARVLAGLDHAFFFGPADRDECVRRYSVDVEKTSIFAFGIDTEFWRPEPDAVEADFVVAVGQDPNRDYELLAAAPGRHPTRIITRQPLRIPPGADNVLTTVGDYFGSDSMSDADIRHLYNVARAVVVPLKDVFQPSGYSVSLQAMACARPLILTRTKGLWAPDAFVDGVNCLLVPPGDSHALGEAIGRIRSDRQFARRLGAEGRRMVERRFPLSANAESLDRLLAIGERIASRRTA